MAEPGFPSQPRRFEHYHPIEHVCECGAVASPKAFRALKSVDPAQRVFVDLRTLYPAPEHHKVDYVSAGVQVNVVVEGQLSMLAMTNQGFQIGLVAFDLEFGRDSTRVNQWVPMRALKPA